jgi:hypothetical protein
VLVAVGLAEDLEAVAVLGESIDEGDDAGGTREGVAPLLEREIGRYDGRALFVASADDVVEEVGGAGVAREIAKLVKLCAAPHNSTYVKRPDMWRFAGFVVGSAAVLLHIIRLSPWISR